MRSPEIQAEIKAQIKTGPSPLHTREFKRGELLAYQCSAERLKTLGLDGQVVHSIPNPGVPCTDPVRVAVHPKTGNVLVTDGKQLWRVTPYPKLSAERVTTLDFSGCFPKTDAPSAQITAQTTAQTTTQTTVQTADQTAPQATRQSTAQGENQEREKTEESSAQTETSRDPEEAKAPSNTKVSEKSEDSGDSGDSGDSEDTDEYEYTEDELEEERSIAEDIRQKESATKLKLYVSKTDPHIICIQSEHETDVIRSAFNAETSALTYKILDESDLPIEAYEEDPEGDPSGGATPPAPEEADRLCWDSIPACAHVPENLHETYNYDTLSLDEMMSADRDPMLASRYPNLGQLCDPSVDQRSPFTHLEDQPQEKCVIQAGGSELFGVSPSGRYITVFTNLGAGCQYVGLAITVYDVKTRPKRRIVTWLDLEVMLISYYQYNQARLGWSPYADALAIGPQVLLFPEIGAPRLMEFGEGDSLLH